MTVDLTALLTAGIKEGGLAMVALGAIAVVVYLMRQQVDDQKRRVIEVQQDKQILIQVVEDNTAARKDTAAALTTLAAVTEKVIGVMSGCEAAQLAVARSKPRHDT